MFPKFLSQVPDQLHMTDGSQISALDRIEFDAFLFPGFLNPGNFIREIPKGKMRKRRMRRKKRRRKRAGFYPHGRNDRQRHRQRAFPYTGDVLHSQ